MVRKESGRLGPDVSPSDYYKAMVIDGGLQVKSVPPQTLKPAVMLGSTPLYPGVYLMAAPRAKGKTVHVLAICGWAAASLSRATNKNVSHRYVYEARTKATMDPNALLGVLTTNEVAAPYSDPTLFLKDFVNDVSSFNNGGLLGIDSVNVPLKSFAPQRMVMSDKAYIAVPIPSSTMPEGMDSKEFMLLSLMNARCVASGVAAICVCSSDLVPYVNKLEGVVEGFLDLLGDGAFTVRDRGRRKSSTVRIPQEHLDMAVGALGYHEPGQIPRFVKQSGSVLLGNL